MKISLIIPTKDREKELNHALQSVFAQTRLPDELVVIDDGNLNLEWLHSVIQDRIPLVYFKKDAPGLVKSRNVGIQRASGDILSFIDDDVELAPNYFEVVEQLFSEDTEKKFGGFGAYTEQGNAVALRGLKNALEKFFLLRGSEGTVLSTAANSFVETKREALTQAEWLSGCNMNFRREVFQDNLFDTFFTEYGYGEDLEFTYRLHVKAGWRFGITGKTSLKHFHTPTSRIAEKRLGFMMVRNRKYIFEKLVPQTPKNKALFAWSVFGEIVLEALNKISNPFKNRGGRIFGMLSALRKNTNDSLASNTTK